MAAPKQAASGAKQAASGAKRDKGTRGGRPEPVQAAQARRGPAQQPRARGAERTGPRPPRWRPGRPPGSRRSGSS